MAALLASAVSPRKLFASPTRPRHMALGVFSRLDSGRMPFGSRLGGPHPAPPDRLYLLIPAGLLVGFGTVWGKRLYQWPWGVRLGQVVCQVLGSRWRVHGHRHAGRHFDARCSMSSQPDHRAGRLGSGLLRWPFVFGGLGFVRHDAAPQSVGLSGHHSHWQRTVSRALGPHFGLCHGRCGLCHIIGICLDAANFSNTLDLTINSMNLAQRSTSICHWLGGAVLFGAGWGLVGYCPGPALASALLSTDALIFTAAMLAGMLICKTFLSKTS